VSTQVSRVSPRPTRAAPRSGAPFPWHRVPFLVAAGLALLAGLDAATLLIGLPAPVTTARLPEIHGALMVLGFVGTLIALERAVALRRRLALASPGLLGAGTLLLLTPLPLAVGQVALVAGSLALVVVYLPLWRRQEDDAVLVQAMGAVLAVGGATLWARGDDIALLLPWLVGFVVLTIAGERLELARLHIGEAAARRLAPLAGALVAATVAATVWDRLYPLLGLALLALVGWLVRHDVARRTVRGTGLPRFAAACLLSGYAWLAVTGTIWLLGGRVVDGGGYDAAVHATFLGFAMSMILAHAPVILPAVLRRPLPYHPAMYASAGLLHAGLLVRLWLGDALAWPGAWRTGATLTIVALLGLVATAVWSGARRTA